MRYAKVDGSTWEVVREDRTFRGGGGTPLIAGTATRVARDVVVFESGSLQNPITLRPGDRPADFVCF